MDKLKMHSKDIVSDHIAQIADLFPNTVTETIKGGKVVRAIDFDMLRQELSTEIVEGSDERYQFTWADKRKSIVLANAPINKTLRPCREESVNFDTTENLYIEGDNLEALKLLQETYLGKVKMIYIDPPYNTGTDFVYEDNFAQSVEGYKAHSGQFDADGGQLVQNLESNGRFHTDWLNMIYPRLKLAKDLMSDNGVIFISIDDHEVENLRKICDEVFGAINFVAQLIWNLRSGSQAGQFTGSHEYILCYSKDNTSLKYFEDRSGGSIDHGALKKISSANPASDITFPPGMEFEGNNAIFEGEIGNSEKQFLHQKMIFENGKLKSSVTINAGWAMRNQIINWINGNETFDSKGQKVTKFYFNRQGILCYQKERGTIHPKTVLPDEIGNTKTGSDEIQRLFGEKIMSFPKPTSLIQYLIDIVTKDTDIVLDFFSGSATTANAVMLSNCQDNGKRKFIMVQIAEKTPEASEARKANYENICEIGKERIRRAGKQIKTENPLVAKTLDMGFRVLKVDASNMQDVYYSPQGLQQDLLSALADNIKFDRTAEDLLFQVMIDLGILLSSPIQETTIGGQKLFNVANGYLLACFDSKVTTETITEIAKQKPYYAIFRDSGMVSDSVSTNFEQIFTTYSPTTVRKVL